MKTLKSFVTTAIITSSLLSFNSKPAQAAIIIGYSSAAYSSVNQTSQALVFAAWGIAATSVVIEVSREGKPGFPNDTDKMLRNLARSAFILGALGVDGSLPQEQLSSFIASKLSFIDNAGVINDFAATIKSKFESIKASNPKLETAEISLPAEVVAMKLAPVMGQITQAQFNEVVALFAAQN